MQENQALLFQVVIDLHADWADIQCPLKPESIPAMSGSLLIFLVVQVKPADDTESFLEVFEKKASPKKNGGFQSKPCWPSKHSWLLAVCHMLAK